MKIKRTGPTERIVIMGMDGTGKTYDALTFGDALPDDSKIFYMDSDNTIPRFLASPRWEHLESRIEWEDARNYEWPQYKQALKNWQKKITPDDLVVIDRAGEPWELAQNYYVERVMGMDLEDYLLSIKTRDKTATKADKDEKYELLKNNIWQGIKTMYGRFVKFCVSCPGNVVLIAAEKPISYLDEENAETMKMWGTVGAKPEGEKHLGNLGHTVLRKTKRVKGQDTTWHLTSLKDRERELLAGVSVTDFVMDYLIPIAGWEIEG